MGHFEINNLTPFAFEPLFVCDETGRPVVAALTKATFDIVPGAGLELSTEQLPVDVQGSFHGDPGASSPRYEPETAFAKPGTDVVLIGHAHAPSTRSRWVDVELRVGRVARRLRVWGDRRWVRRLFGVRATAPERFEKIPLVYERAYGGWDRSSDDPERHSVFPANPVGVGYRAKRARFVAGALLPNIEDPKQLLTKYRGRSVAAGFGFVAPHWEPRRSLAGSYDEAWSRERMPLLPLDFRREFFNAAAPGLVATPHLRGDEVVRVMEDWRRSFA